MKLNIHLKATLELSAPAPTVLQIEAANIEGVQHIESAELYITPYADSQPFRDIYDNPCRRVLLPAGEVIVEYKALVTIPDSRSPLVQAVDTDVMTLPPDIMHYLLPSRYCPSDRMENLAYEEFGNTNPGFARVQAISSWINQHVKYQYGTSTTATTAFDTVAERVGVCRDFAHLGIALCRAMNIPARYVSGYCLELDPPDLHAFFQAYLDGRWVTFDATEVQARPALVTVATGRDAVDCAWCSFFGPGTTTTLEVNVSEFSASD
ncbi:MAG TPA: transglutaminase family protein [Capsulimonadaceae bacterium]